MSRRAWGERLAPGALGLGLGALALGPGLGPGFVLRYDMVFVPDAPWSAAAWGLAGGAPRGFPSSAVVAVLGAVVPGAVLQKAILLGIFVLGAAGVARLLPDAPMAARLVAAAAYVWNPYVAERLLIGQWALLLGYAGLPWAIHAAARHGPLRLGAALVPALVGGFAAWTVTAPVIVAVAGVAGAQNLRHGGRPGESRDPRRGVRDGLVALGVLVVVALPWLVPSVLSAGIRTDPAGVDLFAARADTPFGALGSLLALGGVWNREVVPSGYGQGAVAWIWLALVLAALAGAWYGRRRITGWGGLVAGAVIGYGIAAAGVLGPGRAALRWLVEVSPAFGLLRDGQRFVAPLAVLVAVGLGAGARAVAEACARRGAAGSGRLLAGLGVLLPLMLLPTLAYGGAGRIAAVAYPDDWSRARAIMDADPEPGAVLALPWSAYRGFGWNGGRTVLDPAPLYFPRRVIWNDGLQVGDRTLTPEDPAARAVDAALARPGPILDGHGQVTAPSVRDVVRVRYVLLERQRGRNPNENKFQSRLPSRRLVLQGTDILLYRLVTSR